MDIKGFDDLIKENWPMYKDEYESNKLLAFCVQR